MMRRRPLPGVNEPGGILPAQNTPPIAPVIPYDAMSQIPAGAGTQDFDRYYKQASGDSGSSPDYSKLMALMGGG